MNDPIQFAKLSGSGNDFICLDNLDGRLDFLLADAARVAHFARTLCRRGLSVGADGVIFAVRPEVDGVSDIGARLYEADGSEAELCGNGMACFCRWVYEHGLVPSPQEIRVLTPAGVVRGRNNIGGSYVRVCIPLPEQIRQGQHLQLGGGDLEYDFAVTGVPHAVVFVPSLETLDIARLGPEIRHHPTFAPRGVNANFVQVLGEGELANRTWEFGVEGETMACGTGSAAAAILAARRFHWPSGYFTGRQPVRVHARSGDVLRVHFETNPHGEIIDLCLETVVRYAYNATLHDDQRRAALGDETPADQAHVQH